MIGLPQYSTDDLANALDLLGVRSGDTVMVHTSLLHLGLLNGTDVAAQPAAVVSTLRDILGAEATLAVPAGFWDYGSKGLPYDTETAGTARDLGVVPAYFVTVPGVVRSLNPLYAVAAAGPKAVDLCGASSGLAFGPSSPWSRLLEMDAVNLFLGADLEALMFARYSEQVYGVPYLYNKIYDKPVLRNGIRVATQVVTPVRYRTLDFSYNLSRLTTLLRTTGRLAEAALGGGMTMAVRCRDAHAGIGEGIAQDIHFLLDAPPRYVRGEVPFDVVT